MSLSKSSSCEGDTLDSDCSGVDEGQKTVRVLSVYQHQIIKGNLLVHHRIESLLYLTYGLCGDCPFLGV